MKEQPPGGAPGAGVAADAAGNPVEDPTRNVLDLVDAAIKRQDDLREAESRHLRELLGIRADYDSQLRAKETERIDSIRAVDVQAVQRAAEVQATQAGALAAQVVATADAFRVSLAAALEPLQKDIAELRKSQYEQAGQRAQVVETRGSTTQSWGLVIGIIGAAFGALGVVAAIVFAILRATGG